MNASVSSLRSLVEMPEMVQDFPLWTRLIS
jgi:hypothetical protein